MSRLHRAILPAEASPALRIQSNRSSPTLPARIVAQARNAMHTSNANGMLGSSEVSPLKHPCCTMPGPAPLPRPETTSSSTHNPAVNPSTPHLMQRHLPVASTIKRNTRHQQDAAVLTASYSVHTITCHARNSQSHATPAPDSHSACTQRTSMHAAAPDIQGTSFPPTHRFMPQGSGCQGFGAVPSTPLPSSLPGGAWHHWGRVRNRRP